MQDLDIAGASASAICLGCAQFGSQMSEEESFAQLDRYVELGGNNLDTAHIYGAWAPDGEAGGYGNSELVIGRWLQERGGRDGLFIGSKGGHPDFSDARKRLDEHSLNEQLEQSLDRLRCDHLDIYWLHRDDRDIPVSEILGWLVKPLQQGLISAIGCSHWRIDRLAEAIRLSHQEGLPCIQASQIACSLARQATSSSSNQFGEQLAMDDDTAAFHRESGLDLFAYNSQAAGFFADKYDGCDFLAADFPKPGLAQTYASEANLRRRQCARELAAAKGCSTNQIALAWLLQQPFPCAAIIGPRTLDQLEDSMGAAAISLSKEEWQALYDAV